MEFLKIYEIAKGLQSSIILLPSDKLNSPIIFSNLQLRNSKSIQFAINMTIKKSSLCFHEKKHDRAIARKSNRKSLCFHEKISDQNSQSTENSDRRKNRRLSSVCNVIRIFGDVIRIFGDVIRNHRLF